jgi:hypothetical protein
MRDVSNIRRKTLPEHAKPFTLTTQRFESMLLGNLGLALQIQTSPV